MTAPRLVFDADSHRYTLDGVRRWSVTERLVGLSIINKDYYTWRARVRGKAAHLGAQLVEQGGVDWHSVAETERALSAPVAPYIRGWEKFLEKTGWRSVVIEKPMYHPIYLYVGTPDRIGFWPDGQEGLLDIKTGGPEDWHELQEGAYNEMAPRLSTKGVRRLTTVHLTEDGDFYITNMKDHSAGRVFLAMNATHQWGLDHGVYTDDREQPAAVATAA